MSFGTAYAAVKRGDPCRAGIAWRKLGVSDTPNLFREAPNTLPICWLDDRLLAWDRDRRWKLRRSQIGFDMTDPIGGLLKRDRWIRRGTRDSTGSPASLALGRSISEWR